MRLVEIALDDSDQDKICEFLKEICKLEVKTVRKVMVEKKGVVVGKILKILSKNMEPRKEQVIILMNDVMGNSEPRNKFKAVILGRISTMLMRAEPEIGDWLGFDCGYIYPDPSFIRCVYNTSYNLEIGPGETDQLFFIRKKITMNQTIKESDPTTLETINKLKELENNVNTYMSCMQNLPKVLDSCKAIRKCLENRSQTHQFPEKCNTRVPPSSINESSMGCCEAGPNNSKNTAEHSRSINIQEDFIIPESNNVPRVQGLQSKTGTRNEKESNLNKETRNLDNSSKETRNEKENHVNSLKNNISRVENRRKNFLQPLPIKPQPASRQTKQNEPQPVPKNMNKTKNLNYKYVTIERIKQLNPRISDWCHLFGVVIKILKPMVYTSKGKRTMICLLMDDSCEDDLVCHFFLSDDKILKHICCGDVLRLHRMKLEDNGVRNDGRVFNNNDIVLFKSNSENLTPIKVAIRTSITDEDKARIKTLLEWYQANYERLSQDQNAPETNSETHHPSVQTESGSNNNKVDNDVDDPVREASKSQNLKEIKSHTASAEKVDPIQNKMLEKNSKNNEQKQHENNNNQIKRKPLFVADNNDDLSIAADSIDATGPRSTLFQFDNNISLQSIQNAIGSKNNFVTSTPIRVDTPKEAHNLPEGTGQEKEGSNGITEHQVKALDPTNLTRTSSKPSSDIHNNLKNITYRKRRIDDSYDDSDDEPLINISSKAKRGPSFPTLTPPLLVDLVTPDQLLTEHDQTDQVKALGKKEINKSVENPLQSPPLRLDLVTPEKPVTEQPDDEVETIQNIRATAHSNENDSYTQDELESGSEQESSSGIDLNSLEANLLRGNDEVEDEGQITDDLSEELSSLTAAAALAFQPGPLAVKVHVAKIRPDPYGEILNIVSGYCTEDCKGLFVFADLHWVGQNSHIPLCPTCFLSKGKQNLVTLTFMLTLDLLESDTGFEIKNVILSLDEAEFFFGCSVEEFCKDTKKRKTVQHMLRTLVLNRKCDTSFPFTINSPKIFHLFPNPNLKQIFIRQTKLKYT